jgi:hypothetical protein
MTTLNTKNYSTLVSDFAAAVQGSASALLNFVAGTVLRALAQANASVVMWLQGLVLQLLTVARLATSTGSDVDSFLADFSAFGGRLAAVKSTGQVTFSRATPTIATAVPVGAIVASGDGSQQFTVIADPTNVAYSSAFNNYPILVGISSVSVTVQAVNGGAGGNVSAGGISILQAGIAGVDTVSNASAFTNGLNAESDAAVKIRFQNWMGSLFNASESAITFAIQSVNQNLQVQIIEQPAGSPNVLIYVDDGSGAIAGSLVTAASTAANSVRAAGVSVGVVAASKVTANASMTITTAAGYVHATVVGQVGAAVAAYINGVGLQATPALSTVSYGAIFAAAFGVPGVTDVTNLLLNGGSLDIVPVAGQTIKTGTVSVS